MFEAEFKTGSFLKKLVEAFKELLPHATFDCDNQGVSMQAMDGSHVALVSLQLHAAGFENYRCDRNVSLNVSINSLSKIVKCANDRSSILMKSQDESDVMAFVFNNDNRTCTYTLKLMCIDVEHLGIPNSDYDCVINMSSAEFAQICRDITQFDQDVIVSCSKKGLQFRANGDIGSADVRLNANSENVSVLEARQTTTHTFAGKYLCHFAKAAPLSSAVTLYMSEDLPLKVEYCIQDLGTLAYFLAPKIVNDDDDNKF
ncbi:pcna protein [Thysanoplusia orichalcea nucleopolyhedrovirus]|uniref:Pcna protein n=1 Tax=Thysanoplusia orichalcea nucleopolyhedrovirus TaxID=101850 RepID=L0CL74_9ABAC|nr:pcna protein [Thysanoplusia orichalcea nucleopolyhedrovirus]AGA16200.1 pcna protein [Thysanoplusia orichalcea nucleopolyhedrovirus]